KSNEVEQAVNKNVVALLVKGISEAKEFSKYLKKVGISNIIGDSDDEYMSISVKSKDYYRTIAEIAQYCSENNINSFNYCSPSGKILEFDKANTLHLIKSKSIDSNIVTFMSGKSTISNKIISLLNKNNIKNYITGGYYDPELPYAQYESISVPSKYYHYAIALISAYLSSNKENLDLYYTTPNYAWNKDFKTISKTNSIYYNIKGTENNLIN
ncbi:MAG: hypothetical protein IJX26_00670, partial [Clostridia bacterium]|nr:hypothetical protein [Clostridia bacterium]